MIYLPGDYGAGTRKILSPEDLLVPHPANLGQPEPTARVTTENRPLSWKERTPNPASFSVTKEMIVTAQWSPLSTDSPQPCTDGLFPIPTYLWQSSVCTKYSKG